MSKASILLLDRMNFYIPFYPICGICVFLKPVSCIIAPACKIKSCTVICYYSVSACSNINIVSVKRNSIIVINCLIIYNNSFTAGIGSYSCQTIFLTVFHIIVLWHINNVSFIVRNSGVDFIFKGYICSMSELKIIGRN